MARYISPEEIRSQHIEILGEELGPIFHELYNDIAWAQHKWKEYRTLFGVSAARIEMLDEAASAFFGMAQHILWADMLLHLCRLTDPAEMGSKHNRKQNLSIQRLPSLIPDTGLRSELEVLVSAAVTSTDFARDWRNRHLAHSDLNHALELPGSELAMASRAHVHTSLDALEEVVQRIHESYYDYRLPMPIGGEQGDAFDLLNLLAEALGPNRKAEWRESERAELENADE